MQKDLEYKNFKENMKDLNFHDSIIEEVKLFTDENSNRKCEVIISYYNWEGNREKNSFWKCKKLRLTLEYIAVIEWNAPDLINSWCDILSVEYDDKIDELYNIELKIKEKYPKYLSPLFDEIENFLSITFSLSNFSDDTDYIQGYLRLIGSNVRIKWIEEECQEGKIHIKIKTEDEQ